LKYIIYISESINIINNITQIKKHFDAVNLIIFSVSISQKTNDVTLSNVNKLKLNANRYNIYISFYFRIHTYIKKI